MPSGTPSNRSQLLLSFVAIRRDSCEGSSRTSTANAELARQLGRSRQQGKGDTFLCGRREHLPYQKMTAFFGLGGIGWSSIWIQNSDGGQIVESTPSRPRCYYLALKADAGSVPCSATKIQRPTVLSWAFSFVLPACHAGFPHILRVRPGSCGLAGTSPVALRSALSSLEIGANFFAVAHAHGLLRP